MKRSLALLMYRVMTAALLAGCSAGRVELSAADPVTLTMWHVYGSQTESPLNTLIDKFNRTEGKDRGVAVSVVSVNNSTDIDAALIASAAGDPGSVALPDLFTAYPRVAEKIGTQRLLDWSRYLTEEETQAYLADFLREGQWDDELLMLPIAKSTELCFVNRTLFDRFAEAVGTGADVYDLTDFDRLFSLCSQYCDWSGGGTLFQINVIKKSGFHGKHSIREHARHHTFFRSVKILGRIITAFDPLEITFLQKLQNTSVVNPHGENIRCLCHALIFLHQGIDLLQIIGFLFLAAQIC